MNLACLLANLAQTQPSQAAIIDRQGQQLTFAELDAEATRLATLLLERGAQKGQRVLLLTPMSSKLYITLAALWRIGLVAVVIDPGAGIKHLRAALKRVPIDILIGIPAAFALTALPEVRRIPLKIRVGGWFPGSVDWHKTPQLSAPNTIHLPDDFPALITFTSGSTGSPKAAARTHAFLYEQHQVLEKHLGYTPQGIDLATLPIVSLASLASGRTVLLPNTNLKRPAKIKARQVLDQLQHYPAESIAASPALLHTLGWEALKQKQTLPFQKIFAGGGPVFPRTLEILQKAAPKAKLFSVYGSTEVEPIAHQAWQEVSKNDLEYTRAGGGLLAGKPVEELEILLVPEQGGPLPYKNEQELRADARTTGELLVSGTHVLGSYLDQEHTENKWRNPKSGRIWHRTGDTAHLDDDGRIWLLGRAGKHVSDARGTLYPFAVEAAAMSFKSVERAALLPGTRVLYIQWQNQPDQQVNNALAWAHLSEIRPVEQIPLDHRHNAKVDYTKLARL